MEKQLDILIERYPALSACREDIRKAYFILEEAYSAGRKLLVCGNGGSASDSEHIVGELMKEFKLKRKVYGAQASALKAIDPELGQVLAENLQGALPVISLTGHSSLTTAFMNDTSPELVFAQQVNGYGKPGDVFLGISTSGNSRNVLYAAVTAKSKGLKVIGLTGAGAAARSGSGAAPGSGIGPGAESDFGAGSDFSSVSAPRANKLSALCDVCIRVPETETYRIQELHLPVYHCLCMMLEEHFFGK